MSNIVAISQTQKIIVNPATQAVSVVNAGPPGPPGIQGIPGEDGTEALEEHVNASEPHPAYDDLPNLVLIFNNGLV